MTNDPLNLAQFDGVVQVVGRCAAAFLFLDAARYHLTPAGWAATTHDMVARGVPLVSAALGIAMVVSIVLALALVFKFHARYAALGLALYTIAVSSVMYTPFSSLGYTALVLFLKDLGLSGALLALSTTIERPHAMGPLP